MAALSYMEFLRLKRGLGLRWQGTMLLAAVLEDGRIERDDLYTRMTDAGYSFMGAKTFDVVLCQTNKRLPATVRIEPRYPDGIKLPVKAIAYVIESEWGIDYLRRVARGENPAIEAQPAERAA